MSVRVMDYTSKVEIDVTRKASIFLRVVAEAIKRSAMPKTPRDTGRLRESPLIQVLGKHATLEWRKVYAAVQERGVIRGSVIRNYTTPGTGAHYAENAVKQAVNDTPKHLRTAGL